MAKEVPVSETKHEFQIKPVQNQQLKGTQA
jgi:hypothetical protein